MYSDATITKGLRLASIGYTKMVKSELLGQMPVNRPKHLSLRTRRAKQLTGKSNWFARKMQTDEEVKMPAMTYRKVKDKY